MAYRKCKFQRMGTKTHQLGNTRVNPKETKKKLKDKERRLNEWRKWWC